VRLNVAGFMSAVAMKFLALHEFRHLVGGHVSCNPISVARHALFEVASTGGAIDTNLVDQCLEIDADSIAALSILKTWIDLDINSPEFPAFLKGIADPRPTLVVLISAAVCGTIKAFGPLLPTYDDWDESDHPPDEVRQYQIRRCFQQYLKKWGYDDLADNTGIDIEVQKIIFIHLHQVFGDPAFSEEEMRNFYAVHGPCDSHLRRLLKVLESIQPELEKVCYIKGDTDAASRGG
jgi:hypothetical protein